MLSGKKIILGVTGGIAAYKSAQIVRLLVQKGAEVRVVMTPLAKEFITPLTMATLSKNPILVDFFDPTNGKWNSHVDMGLWADALLIAPATANTIAKMATGVADNLLITTYLSAKCPVFIAPAMDLDMFAHPSTKQNLNTLRSYGNHIIEPTVGELASGLEGKGRMEEPENIVRYMHDFFVPKDMQGKKVLITAGPTYEMIDPVRFIGNFSSGKMGFALAENCARRGAEVTLVCGPVSLSTPYYRNIERINVESAQEMHKFVVSRFESVDGAILCAAVADFTPVATAATKMKRGSENIFLELKPSVDIAAEIGKIKKPEQFIVGFALETNNEEENAIKKMDRKNFDFIVLNSLRDPDSGFGFDTNKVTILHRSGLKKEFELKSKLDVADDIVKEINTLIF
ncbi:MAG: bifunctional phosphopantothenoylcysteine decarboxylase/phosphopantothenate--cysteine ligase CoaBC [Paludibacter sp.]|nr:bifunctional phosphopantothenoylcysteine decarboxylase/phosphopantothenate--cysteine ligase CoaBC [Paludibacter sp.]MDD4199215.1 bifunctional phosphopantothenoylcysteine decarboxylase/phosphopantothenate--cysteine ligase CoaBC [Paludibacter sp.]MDD4428649.1 bifunctional phosphopantothenoylcysteine decarboxylase/phosphopantothenate--cysteine ligase CoaBC [Paludibacter sp.]